MPNVQIKNVPAPVHGRLKERAAREGKSLQEYLLERLTAEAEQPTLDEVFARVEEHTDGSAPFETAADAVRADREHG